MRLPLIAPVQNKETEPNNLTTLITSSASVVCVTTVSNKEWRIPLNNVHASTILLAVVAL
jgi:hypothetical protein